MSRTCDLRNQSSSAELLEAVLNIVGIISICKASKIGNAARTVRSDQLLQDHAVLPRQIGFASLRPSIGVQF